MSASLRSEYLRAAMCTDAQRPLRVLLETGSIERFEELLPPRTRARFLRLKRAGDGSSKVDPMRMDAESLASLSGRYFTPLCTDWPKKLMKRGLLRVMGPLALNRTCAVVGTRKSSSEGLHRAREVARLLAMTGHTLISGGALGVDIHALRAADAVGGATVTVLGSGLLHPTPTQHHTLYQSFLKKGAIVSSFKCHQRATRWTFAKRNEWIAALADTCVVIEGNLRSGALMAARHALKMGKPVFVRTSIHPHINTSGCHRLLDEGALPLWRLVAQLRKRCPEQHPVQGIQDTDGEVLNYLSLGPATPDELTNALNLHYTLVVRSLGRLEEMRFVQRAGRGRWYRTGLRIDGDKAWWRSILMQRHRVHREMDSHNG